MPPLPLSISQDESDGQAYYYHESSGFYYDAQGYLFRRMDEETLLPVLHANGAQYHNPDLATDPAPQELSLLERTGYSLRFAAYDIAFINAYIISLYIPALLLVTPLSYVISVTTTNEAAAPPPLTPEQESAYHSVGLFALGLIALVEGMAALMVATSNFAGLEHKRDAEQRQQRYNDNIEQLRALPGEIAGWITHEARRRLHRGEQDGETLSK